MPHASDEFELIRRAARAHLSPDETAALDRAAAGPLDWAKVMRLGAYHKTLPLLYAHLRDHPEMPPAATEWLRAWVWKLSTHVLFLSSEMARIARRFSELDIPYLILKGPSLSPAYGGVSKRPFVDNDVLVRRGDFGRVEQALTELGFNERKRSDWQQAGYLSVHGEYTFGRSVGELGSTVDVHTRLVPVGYSYAPDLGRLTERSRSIDVAGESVPALSWDDLFLALSVNALKDQWDRLRLVSDIAEVARHVTDWDGIAATATRNGVRRALHLAVLLATDLVDADIPQDVVARAQQDRRSVRLSQSVQQAMVEAEGQTLSSLSHRIKLNMLVQDGLAGQLRYTAYTALRRATERLVATQR